VIEQLLWAPGIQPGSTTTITYLKDDQQVAKATEEDMYRIIFPPSSPLHAG